MKEQSAAGILETTIEKVKDLVNVSTIIGEPMNLDCGITIIPVSKVSFGFASGGSDLPSKTQSELFGGGSGAGITIQPLAFLVVSKGEVKLLQMSMNANSSNAIINMVPEVFDKISSMIKKDEKDSKK